MKWLRNDGESFDLSDAEVKTVAETLAGFDVQVETFDNTPVFYLPEE